MNTSSLYDLVLGLDRSDKKADLCLIDTHTGTRRSVVIGTAPEALWEWLLQLRQQYPDARAGHNTANPPSRPAPGPPIRARERSNRGGAGPETPWRGRRRTFPLKPGTKAIYKEGQKKRPGKFTGLVPPTVALSFRAPALTQSPPSSRSAQSYPRG